MKGTAGAHMSCRVVAEAQPASQTPGPALHWALERVAIHVKVRCPGRPTLIDGLLTPPLTYLTW